MDHKTNEPESPYISYDSAEILKYWDAIKEATDEIKLKLISMLSLSIANKQHKKEKDEEIIDSIFGSWSGSESAEEIINIIQENRSCKEPPILD